MSSSRSGEAPVVKLNFTIAGSSEPSGTYVAQNILLDNPFEQTSRWSGAYQSSSNVKQWVLLRLENLSILESITFGKFHKPHPCNMKDFKVLVGITEDNMVEVLHAGLKNDFLPETFKLKHSNRAGILYPTRYVKIVPLSAHGQSFHMSIWYVSLSGISDEEFVEKVREQHDNYRETVVLRQILKHLRQRRFLTPYHDILSRSGLRLEHPLITSLHESLVLRGNWSHAEGLIRSASETGLFVEYGHACQPRASWRQLQGLDADGDKPPRRGGHAMCMDEQHGLIYLFGGWDGQKSVDDFWVYDIAQDVWRLLSPATSREKNGPSPRACHKMVFDSKTGSIYLLGRLSDGDDVGPPDIPSGPSGGDDDDHPSSSHARSPSPRRHEHASTHAASTEHTENYTGYCSEFYRYHTRGLDAGKWDLLAFDTASMGGPPLIFDHQMVMDSEAQIIYVSGGRVVDNDWETAKHAGMYAYDVHTSKWRSLQTSDTSNTHPSIPARYGHSMVFEPQTQHLIIFAGQRDGSYLSDMYAFHIPTNTVTELFPNITASGGPNACFTQRAVIDCELREIYVFGGLTRARPGTPTVLESEALNYIYRYTRADSPGKWTKIVDAPEDRETSDGPSDAAEPEKPVSRYAHQVVYDPRTKTAYMHGGNDGLERDEMAEEPEYESGEGYHDVESAARRYAAHKETRLDDFWSMQLHRPGPDEVIRRATYEVRQQKFREMCEDGPAVTALSYLQTDVASVVDHDNNEEASVFRSLLSHLLAAPSRSAPHNPGVEVPPLSATSSVQPPRKRSHSDGPGGVQDSVLADVDEPMADVSDSANLLSQTAVLRRDEDPLEKELHMDAPLSGKRYKQRTEVFERLLLYVNEDAKQPQKDLLDLVDGGESA